MLSPLGDQTTIKIIKVGVYVCVQFSVRALYVYIIDAVGVDSRNKRTRYLTKQKIAFQRALESRHQPTNTCEKSACKAHYPPLLVVKQSATTKRAGASGNKSERRRRGDENGIGEIERLAGF
jgi:hypothetical protein